MEFEDMSEIILRNKGIVHAVICLGVSYWEARLSKFSIKNMERSKLHDNFVSFNKKLARLKETTLHLQKEECFKNNEEPEDIKMAEANCGLCKGEKNCETHVHIQELCPADRKRIARLIEKLAECTQAKNKAEIDFAESRAENEALLSRYELFYSKEEEEKSQLKSLLSEKTAQLNELRLQTAKLLEILTEQVKAQEQEYLKLTDTVKELLRNKVHIENALTERCAKVQLLEAETDRTRENFEVEKLLFLKEYINAPLTTERTHQECQTEEYSHFKEELEFQSKNMNLEKSKSLAELKNPKSNQTMSKDDLENPSPDNMIIQELFFKTPNIDGNLVIFPNLSANLI